MKIRMLTSVGGADFNAGFGDELELPKEEAERFIAAGFAEAVSAPAKKPATKKPAAKK